MGRAYKPNTERLKLRFELETFLLWGDSANHHSAMHLSVPYSAAQLAVQPHPSNSQDLFLQCSVWDI